MVTRREALKGAVALAVACALPNTACRKDEVPPPNDPVFGFGVASGDPLPDAVIIWTRVIASKPIGGRWEVSKDATFATIAASGVFLADAARGWTVKVDVTGLEPGTTYYYRFRALERSSVIGRTRTAPLDAKRLRFAVVSCASVPHGYFHVYRAIAARPDIDAVLHLGDYLYEYAEGEYGSVRESEPANALRTLDDYRARYAQYRRDPDLQEAHRQHPFINIWDDHEFVDNSFRDGTTGDNDDVGPWADQRRAASQAYDEWIPIRSQPGDRVWRALRYGTLVDLFMLDTRIWGRDIQLPPGDPALANHDRQLLGADQETWLAEQLRTSTARWKLVGQQVMMSAVPAWFRDDGWDDYPAARGRFFDLLERESIRDVVVLSGDVHTSWANELVRAPDAPPLAVELVTPAVTSPGNESRSAVDLAASASFIKYVDLTKNGFILLSVFEERAHASWYYVQDVEEQDGGATTFGAGFAVYRGQSRLENEPVEPDVFAAPPPAPA